ncbi:unnamed protein product [Ceratitis capitata]|uniref:(Mediterranean fruit fly) hypothetical protein n=1 Tax=Ceratitis capitata TaxID=7213 RepID=A0A811UET1_CERCA|nr:unnamed protein product [Ceratitis capitata]
MIEFISETQKNFYRQPYFCPGEIEGLTHLRMSRCGGPLRRPLSSERKHMPPNARKWIVFTQTQVSLYSSSLSQVMEWIKHI